MTDQLTEVGMLTRIKRWFRPAQPMHNIWLDGIGARVLSTKENGKVITVTGWRDDHWKFEKGHVARFLRREGGDVRPSTYRILDVRHCHDPADMYFLDCEYVGMKS